MCSHVAGVEIEVEVEYTTGIPHMRVLVVSEEEMAVSRIVPDAPSRSHKRPAPVGDYGREWDRPAGEEWRPRIVWTDQAMMKGRV